MEDALTVVLFFALAIAYALICRWIGNFANSKGYSYWAFALFSFFATPILGFAVAALIPERRGEHRAPLRNTPA
jgi:hypothetical protein